MTEPRYECWAIHREDITERVRACVESRGHAVVTDLAEVTDALRQNTCIVLCSENHENVFYLET
jgi:hypothetical protein